MSKLEEIIDNLMKSSGATYYKDPIRYAMQEYAEWYAKQCLEIAAEHSTLLENSEPLLVPRRIWEAYDTSRVDIEFEVDKQSITNIKLPDHE